MHKIIRTRGQRIAWTNTGRIPDARLVEAVKFVAAEVNLDRVVLHAKGQGDWSRTYGRMYPQIPSIANLNGLKRWEWRYMIVVRDHGGDFLGFLSTLAHEAKHVEQYRERKLARKEPRARAFAAWIVEQWNGAGA
jgi:hypothetical protein